MKQITQIRQIKQKCDDGPFQPYYKQQIVSLQTDTVVLNRQHEHSTPLLWTDKAHVAGEGRAVRRHDWRQIIAAASLSGEINYSVLRER